MAWPSDWATQEALASSKLNAWNAAIKTWGGDVNTSGYAIIFENTAPTDLDIPNLGVVIWIDESTNKLKFRLRYAAGTLKSGEINLA